MNILNFFGSVLESAMSVMKDDNGHPYRDDNGGYYPNNEYDIDGTHYETDDNGSIYRADGKYYPDDYFEIDGDGYYTDSDGNLQN